MSVWTHVAGCIRIDDVDFVGDNPIRGHLEAMLGPAGLWENPDVWEGVSLPMGSEGSLQYTIWTRPPGDNSINRANVLLFGDLRDFDDENVIVEWYKEFVQRMDQGWVRGAVISIAVETKNYVTVIVDEGPSDPSLATMGITVRTLYNEDNNRR